MISIDAMGGDHGPGVIGPAVGLAAQVLGRGAARFLLHGDAAVLEPIITQLGLGPDICEIRHTNLVIPTDAKPAHAMRRGGGTSMWNAVDCVRSGEAHAAVSAGNTGALMAISRLRLRMMADLDRPALVANWPTLRGTTAVLDVGANLVCDADRLVEFAIMGAAYQRAVRGTQRPSVGVLNVGTETEKGNEAVRAVDRRLRAGGQDFDYYGFVEGDDIANGTVEVVVTDGFTGNAVLKTAEGLARFFRSQLRDTFTSTPLARAGAFIAQSALRHMAERLNPSAINGGPFLGLRGIVVKSHGSADARGVATAIQLAFNLAQSDFIREVEQNLKQIQVIGPSEVARVRSA